MAAETKLYIRIAPDTITSISISVMGRSLGRYRHIIGPFRQLFGVYQHFRICSDYSADDAVSTGSHSCSSASRKCGWAGLHSRRYSVSWRSCKDPSNARTPPRPKLQEKKIHINLSRHVNNIQSVPGRYPTIDINQTLEIESFINDSITGCTARWTGSGLFTVAESINLQYAIFQLLNHFRTSWQIIINRWWMARLWFLSLFRYLLLSSSLLTGQTNGTDTVGGCSTWSMGDQRQFTKVATLGNLIDLNFDTVLSDDGDANGAGLDKVHSVGHVALSDDASVAVERARVQRVGHVHSLVRLSKQQSINIIQLAVLI